MKVIFGKENAERFKDKYIVLEMDTFNVTNIGELNTYCVLSAEEIALGQLTELQHWTKFHDKLLNGYKTKQWNFCLDCIVNLRGKFGGEIDSFYDNLKERIESNIENGVPDDWTPVLQR